MKKNDLTGHRFNRLVVMYESSERTKSGKVQWICKCDCGNETITTSAHLLSGHTKSCSCLQKEVVRRIDNSTHKMVRTPTYNAWLGMKSRCYNKSNVSYQSYGEKGIIVCKRWLNSFENFLSDMGERPSSKHSLDRIDNDGNYSKENCRWADVYTQANNKSTNVFIECFGETKTLKEWARTLKISYNKLSKMHRKGVDVGTYLKSIKNG